MKRFARVVLGTGTFDVGLLEILREVQEWDPAAAGSLGHHPAGRFGSSTH